MKRKVFISPVLLYACMAGIAYSLGLAAIFAMVPLMLAFYLKGKTVFIRSTILFILIIAVIRIVKIVLSGGQTTTALGGGDFSDTSMTHDSVQMLSSQPRMVLYEAGYVLSSVISVYILLQSSLRWIPRLVIASFFPFVSSYMQMHYIQTELADGTSPLNSVIARLAQGAYSPGVHDSAHAGTALSSETLMGVLFFATLFIWAVMVALLLLNWIIAVLIVRRVLKFNLHHYLLHVYSVVTGYSSPRPLFALIASGVLFGLTAVVASGDSSVWNTVNRINGNVLIMLLFCYMLYGICAGYFFISRRVSHTAAVKSFYNNHNQTQEGQVRPTIRLRCDWYFFIICVILVLPVFSIALSIMSIVFGIIQHIKNIQHTRHDTNTAAA